MTVETPGFANQASTYGAEQTRRAVASLLQRGATIGSIAGGIVAPGDMSISAGGGMSVAVAPGEAWVPGSAAATQSGYYCRVASTTALSISSADPSNPRIDRIVALITDSAYSGSTDTFAVAVVTGVPTSGATLSNLSGRSAAPANSLTLGNVLVPAGASSIVSGDIGNTVRTVEPSFISGLSIVNVVASGTFGAANGELELCSGGVTVNLPSPVAGTTVGVMAAPTVSGAGSPVTVSGNGNLILGPGLSTAGVGSFTLGQALSGAVLFAIGGEWVILPGGKPDSGWQAVTLNTGISVLAGVAAPSSRLEGARVRLKGGIQNTSGSNVAGGTSLFTLAVGTRPPTFAVGVAVAVTPGFIAGVSAYTGAAELAILTNGQALLGCDMPASATCNFDDAEFSID